MFLKFARLMKEDVALARQIDPAARSSLEVALTYSGIHAIWFHRIAHFLYLANFFLIARIFSQLSRLLTGVEIHPAAQIDRGVFIDHGMGVVIGETAVVGQGCHLYQGVTLGGTSTRHEKRHPTLGEAVTEGAGAKIIGAVKIVNNVRIGAGSVVITSVPDGATVVGVPGHITSIVGISNETVERLPDPEWERLEAIEDRINAIEEFLAKNKE